MKARKRERERDDLIVLGCVIRVLIFMLMPATIAKKKLSKKWFYSGSKKFNS